MNLGFFGKGNTSKPAGIKEQIEAGACGLKLHEDWGTTPAAIDNCLTVADRMRRAGGDPHRHAERIGLRRDHARRLQGPRHRHLPHRGRGRRPCARHHPAVRREERAAVVDQSDHALHGQHRGRASRHADGLPPSRPGIPEDVAFAESRIRQGDHRRRGHPARPGRLLDDVVRQPGDGPGRRGRDPHLADRRQDEEAARPAEGGEGRQRQRARQALRRQVHDQSRHHPRHLAPCRLGRGRQARRPGDLVAGLLRREARRGADRRHDRGGADGRSQRLDPDAAAGALPADVRRLRQEPCREPGAVRLAGRRSPRAWPRSGASAGRCWR